VAEDDPDVQDLKEHGGHGEEVHGSDPLEVILQETLARFGKSLIRNSNSGAKLVNSGLSFSLFFLRVFHFEESAFVLRNGLFRIENEVPGEDSNS
jgi:hypothetical protein